MNSTFLKGEKPTLWFVIRNTDDEAIVVTSASWTLTDQNRDIIASGSCRVDEFNIMFELPMNESGDFQLDITAEIPPETIKERMMIRVVE